MSATGEPVQPGDYVARLGPTWQTTTWGVVCLVAGGLIIGFGGGVGIVVAVVILLLGALITITPLVRRGRLAVRVDERGIEFGLARTILLPWKDIVAVFELRAGRSRWLGVQPVSSAELPGRPGRASRGMNRMVTGAGVPAEAVDFSIPIQGWGY